MEEEEEEEEEQEEEEEEEARRRRRRITVLTVTSHSAPTVVSAGIREATECYKHIVATCLFPFNLIFLVAVLFFWFVLVLLSQVFSHAFQCFVRLLMSHCFYSVTAPSRSPPMARARYAGGKTPKRPR